MPLSWTIDSQVQLVTAVADGEVLKEEVVSYMGAMMEANAGTYRKLFDASRGRSEMGSDDILELGVRARRLHELVATGPLAIVVPPGNHDRFLPLVGILAAADRPIRVFTRPRLAQAWLDEPDIRRWRGKPKASSAPPPDLQSAPS